jgi:hypothetical protein
VTLAGSEAETKRILSNSESQPRRASDQASGSFESQQVQADDTRERKHVAELNHVYDEVISHLGDVDCLLICGPGEARTELKKRLERKSKSGPEVTLKPADNMTEPQLVAMIRQHFA